MSLVSAIESGLPAVTAFLGGSRSITDLSPEVKERLRTIADSGLKILVGDADGADRAIQRFLVERHPCYENVEVFCSGAESRNNLGKWRERHVDAGHARGFAFYAAKDAEMAREADVGLVIWDSKSPGSLKQVERMASAGKTVVVYVNPERRFVDIKGQASWARFVSTLPSDVRSRMEAKPNPPTITHRQPGLF